MRCSNLLNKAKATEVSLKFIVMQLS